MKLTIKVSDGFYIAVSEDIECLQILAESVGLNENLYIADEEIGAGLLKGLNKMQAQLLESAFKGRHRRAVVKWLEEPVEEKKEYIGLKIGEPDATICYMLDTFIYFDKSTAKLNAYCTLSELKEEVENIKEFIIATCNDEGEPIDYYIYSGAWKHVNKKVELVDPPVVKAVPYSKPKINKPKKQNDDNANSIVVNNINGFSNIDDNVVESPVNPVVNKEAGEITVVQKSSALSDILGML